ncbi:MAG: hypothetical protein ACREFX_08975 [Opitutaceae bacterium]
MTRFRLLFVFSFFPAASALAVATVPVGTVAAQAPQKVFALPMTVSKAPLGNVVRLCSAKYGVPFTIEAHAKAPITGDFTGMDLKSALAETARQAGLFVIPEGKRPADGFRLSLHEPPALAAAMKAKPPLAAAAPPAPAAANGAAAAPVSASERVRAELLQERARLQREAAKLGS